MTALLRYRCASLKLLAFTGVLMATSVSSVFAQSSFAPVQPPVYVGNDASSQYGAPYGDPGVQAAYNGYGCSDCGDCGECYADGCYPCDDYACECAPCPPPGVPCFVFGEFLYIRASDADVAHAQQQNGTGGAGTVPFGRIGTVDMDYEPAFRVGGGIGLDQCSCLIATYTRFEDGSADELFAPTVPGGGGAVGSLVHHPGAAITASAGPVTANYDIDYHVADVLFRDVWRAGNCHVLNYFLGGQYANLNQEFAQNGIFSGSSGGAIDTATDIEFNGGGLKIGLDGERWLGGGVSVYGKVSASALSGRFNSRYSLDNATTEIQLAESLWKDNRVISLFEYELGLAMTSCNQRWRASAGYLFQHWGNMVTTSNFIDGVQVDNYTDLSDVISFDGLTSRLEFRW